MTTPLPPGIDPRLVAQLSNDVGVLDRQLGQVGRGLAALRFQLDQAVAQPVPAQNFAQPQNFAPRYVAPPAPTMPPPMPPLPQQRPVQPPAAEPRTPWWQRDGVISRILAVAGAGVTLIGIVMLLVLAAQAGFFGPVARVVAGAIFSGALVFAGTRVFGRTGGRVGGIALAATGIAGGYLDVLATTAIYGWLEAPIGLAVALGVAAAGVALASAWKSQPLAVMVVAGVAVLAPIVTDGLTLTLVAFLIVLQAACFTAQVRNDWRYLHIARTVPVVLALLGAVANSAATGSAEDFRLLVAAAVVAVVGIATTYAAVRARSADVTAGIMLGIAAAPLVLAGLLFDRPVSVVVEAVTAAALLTIAAYRALPAHTRVAALVPAVIATLATCVTATTHDTLAIALLVVAAAFVALSDRSKVAYGVGLGFAAVGGLIYLDTARVNALAQADVAARQLGGAALVASVVLVAVAALVVRQTRRLGADSSNVVVVSIIAGLVALYGFTAATVTIGVSLGDGVGFTVGHTVATIAWMVIATALLLRGLRIDTNAHAVLAVGLSLTAAALAKLFLFDLATLDGLLRVAAFIGVGLLLLMAGTRYARAFAERDGQATGASAG